MRLLRFRLINNMYFIYKVLFHKLYYIFKTQYNKNVTSIYKIRKLTHIIEKGINNEKFEKGHSKNKYEILKKLIKNENCDSKTDEWSKSVIFKYEQLQNNKSVKNSNQKINNNKNVENVIYTRRSNRNFYDDNIEIEIINKIFYSINWAPNSCNRQPSVVFITKQKDKIEILRELFSGCTNFSKIIPYFIVFCTDLRAYSFPSELFLPYIDTSLGIQNCCLLAKNYDLSITLLSWEQHDKEADKKIRNMLSIPNYFEIVAGGVLGKPKYIEDPPMRKDIEFTLRWI